MSLRLRQVDYSSHDAVRIRALMRDEYFEEYFRRTPPEFAATVSNGDKYTWIIEEEDNQQFVGLVSLAGFDPHARKVEVGWLLSRAAPRSDDTLRWLLREVGKYVFDYMEYRQMYSLTLAHRIKLHERMERLGCERIAVLPENCHFKGKYWDEIMHRFTVDRYKEIR